MADERVVSDIVTKFFLNTCRLCPQLSRYVLQAATWCSHIATRHLRDGREAIATPLTTGSVAEFYIEPMLPHVNDVDLMFHQKTQLAIPRGHLPPTRLSAEFSDFVKVFEIEDSHLPCYVYLKLRYLLTECTDGNKYNYIVYDSGPYFPHREYDVDERYVHGPAICTDIDPIPLLTADVGPALLRDNTYTSFLSVDRVSCVRCLLWPPQTADWPTRHRNYGWPDSATVDRVVSNGCDVVGVAHRQCRQHEWMGKYQHRLSFSRAEILLLNSWMPVQQIVYHMLRVYVKTERLTEGAESEAFELSNYHIKTLMMWAVELKSNSFWTADLNLIRICVELLHTLSVWLRHTRCDHYFVRNCNLIHNTFGVEIIARQLQSVNQAWLSNWFVKNYVLKCAMLCADSVSSLFSDVSTEWKLQNAVSAVVEWRRSKVLEDMWRVLRLAEFHIPLILANDSLIVGTCDWCMTEFPKSYSSLPAYFTAVAFLYVAYKLSRIGFTDDLMDVLATLVGQLITTRRHPSQYCSELSLSKAAMLMKVIANSSRTTHSTMQRLEIELSKTYLYRALGCKDLGSDSIYCLANIFLALLFYTSGQYHTAIDYCTLVMRSQDHSQCSSHVVQGALLPKVDDHIDIVLGLAVFYQYVRTAALNQRQTQHVSVFTTELFAHYLNVRCLSMTQISVTQMSSDDDEVHRLRNYVSNMQPFTADVLAVKSVIHNFNNQPIAMVSSHQSTPNSSNLNTTKLVELLQRSAVEHLTIYRQLEARDFGSITTIVTTDFEALYAYKHGDYQRCLQLSTQNVRTLLYADYTPLVMIFPELIQLLDDDIVSLTALTLIVNPKCRHKEAGNAYISQLTLSLYLMTQCQLKLHNSVTSLAQTLDYIEVAQRRHSAEKTLNHLTLKLMKRSAVQSIVKMLHNSASLAANQD